MSVHITTMKTHKRENLTKDYPFINPCIKHGVKPEVWNITAGKRKESHYLVYCTADEECNKLGMNSADEIVAVWNSFNPLNNPSNA